jgi:23S rRNA U2552 (ribose-2'-O)-methylase RlmE/FtsJ
MIYFLIPRTINTTYKNLECTYSEVTTPIFISNSLSNYLFEMKNKINEKEKEWNIYKKYTNLYEYINTNIPTLESYNEEKKWKLQRQNFALTVSKYKPLSRSFFKMIEIMNFFNINSNFQNRCIKSFHLCEGPGGFIEALISLRKKHSKKTQTNDKYYGMTIIKNDAPSWKKGNYFLKENKNIIIENGIDETGDILSKENFQYCKNKYGSSIDFITADGGFDFSNDFNNQEASIVKLLFAQIAYALCMQKENGSFILKIFDCFMHHTVDLLNILSSFYEKVYITKPYTSRYANSEKYIVCCNFVFSSNELFYPYINITFAKMLLNNPIRFLNNPTCNYFITKIEEFNSFFGMNQIDNISNTFSLIESKKIPNEDFIKNNILLCISWCIKNDIQYNSSVCEFA